ncbi:Zinc finger, RING-type [Corchorus olitorius]|uniref:Zinc finger, RING-type n=1 Tax=Corchorus olitorius TaxID=93759 RepID=A0A1R3G2P7_9ROSI|nr:Zinc finger, RING-type [Corchorus olitorius]
MEGLCIHCKTKPEEEESVDCVLCNATWHDTCLFNLREMYEFTESDWGCPDCNDKNNPNQQGAVAAATATAEGINMLGTAPPNNSSTSSSSGDTMVAKILAIQADPSLTEEEKARKRQELLGGNEKGKGKEETVALTAASGDENFNCCICFNVLDRPVSTPCGHNLCLNCFVQSLKKSGKRNCPVCRNLIPTEMAKQPRINVTLVIAIRSAKMSWNRRHLNQGPSTDYVRNEDKPDEAYTTERAKKGGMANAKSGKIFVNVKNDHFGPILAEHDLKRNLGVEVGETWGNRLECRQWGVHFPQIKGIAGQKDQGAQSVILSGGYEDDEDHGEWFLYTGRHV